MEDTKEKGADLNSEDLDKVSGGYIEYKIRHDGEDVYIEKSAIRCDVCGSGYELTPFNGGHLCRTCLNKRKKWLN